MSTFGKVRIQATDGSNIVTDDEIVVPALITEDIFHYTVHEGLVHIAAASGSGDLYICFTTGAVNPFHVLWSHGGMGAGYLHIYEGCTFQAGGSDRIAYNSNRCSTMNGRGASSCLAGQTGTVGSVQIGQAPSALGTQINPGGFFSSRSDTVDNASNEFVLELSTNYCFHFEEVSASAHNGITLRLFEVPLAA